MSKIGRRKSPSLLATFTTNYRSWAPFTQARYLHDLRKSLGLTTTFGSEHQATVKLMATKQIRPQAMGQKRKTKDRVRFFIKKPQSGRATFSIVKGKVSNGKRLYETVAHKRLG